MESSRDLLAALEGILRDLRNIDRRLESIERELTRSSGNVGVIKAAQELDGRRISAMRIESAASLSRIEAATRALHKSAGEAAKAAGQIEKAGREITGEFKAYSDKDEISTQHIKLRWSTLAKYAPWVIKGAALLAAAAAAAWGIARTFFHKLTD